MLITMSFVNEIVTVGQEWVCGSSVQELTY